MPPRFDCHFPVFRVFRARMFRLFRPCLFAAALGFTAAASAAEQDTAQRLWLAGQRSAAISWVEDGLRTTPNDLNLRFTLGVMRMEMGELKPAAEIFTRLSQDFPDLADPFNNLAVIHAAQGDLDLAQADLNQALTLQPTHAQALENLGDVLLRQAERAYQNALKHQVAPLAATQGKLKNIQALLKRVDTPSP
ncbi:tetratricopeptide repeat protein [Roseateles koreensis]|uniref:Tetratricopeptide repeat protein n=1 Tax=Roseateles koreensis TaxID=2987526 RepID=A0ABT5KLX0_9BURK|nr:tetratricopeptide repeat protein [Roseateles koreensis]MDC8783904.1 hypothetical protein [Roseateles koreensis]